jgi:hypothetical protein
MSSVSISFTDRLLCVWREVIFSYIGDDLMSLMAPGMSGNGRGQFEAHGSEHCCPNTLS